MANCPKSKQVYPFEQSLEKGTASIVHEVNTVYGNDTELDALCVSDESTKCDVHTICANNTKLGSLCVGDESPKCEVHTVSVNNTELGALCKNDDSGISTKPVDRYLTG